MERIVKLYNKYQLEEIEPYEGRVYHYTSPNGLYGIIENKKIYGSDLLYLNDESEGVYVFELVKSIIGKEEYLDEFSEHIVRCINNAKEDKYSETIKSYSISFSMEKDSLQLWNYYTKGNCVQGYNIGFEGQTIEKDLRIGEKAFLPKAGKIIYDKEQQITIVKRIIEDFGKLFLEMEDENKKTTCCDYLVQKLITYGKFFKAPQFSGEEEFRILYRAVPVNEHEANNGCFLKENFRIHNGIFVPYINVSFQKEAIKEICFSPSLYNQQSKASLRRFLVSNEMSSVEIEQSQIPLKY